MFYSTTPQGPHYTRRPPGVPERVSFPSTLAAETMLVDFFFFPKGPEFQARLPYSVSPVTRADFRMGRTQGVRNGEPGRGRHGSHMLLARWEPSPRHAAQRDQPAVLVGCLSGGVAPGFHEPQDSGHWSFCPRKTHLDAGLGDKAGPGFQSAASLQCDL